MARPSPALAKAMFTLEVEGTLTHVLCLMFYSFFIYMYMYVYNLYIYIYRYIRTICIPPLDAR